MKGRSVATIRSQLERSTNSRQQGKTVLQRRGQNRGRNEARGGAANKAGQGGMRWRRALAVLPNAVGVILSCHTTHSHSTRVALKQPEQTSTLPGTQLRLPLLRPPAFLFALRFARRCCLD